MDTSKIIYLCAVIVIGSGCLFGVFMRMEKGFGEYNTKVYGITLISILVTTLALSDINPTNLSPAYGILGAIGGYLFGLKSEKKNKNG